MSPRALRARPLEREQLSRWLPAPGRQCSRRQLHLQVLQARGSLRGLVEPMAGASALQVLRPRAFAGRAMRPAQEAWGLAPQPWAQLVPVRRTGRWPHRGRVWAQLAPAKPQPAGAAGHCPGKELSRFRSRFFLLEAEVEHFEERSRVTQACFRHLRGIRRQVVAYAHEVLQAL